MKLIDWTTMPEGVAVMMGNAAGEFVCHALDKDICYVKTTHVATPNMGYKTIRERKAEDLRLAPADQQDWLLYEGGKTVIPEWAAFSFKVKDYKRETRGHIQIDADLYTESFTDRVISDNTVYRTGQPFAYKITGVKTGWTDNHEEATE